MSQAQAETTGWARGTDECGKMKEAGTSHKLPLNTGATNSSGFTWSSRWRTIQGSSRKVFYQSGHDQHPCEKHLQKTSGSFQIGSGWKSHQGQDRLNQLWHVFPC
jgi:hypothetical protein